MPEPKIATCTCCGAQRFAEDGIMPTHASGGSPNCPGGGLSSVERKIVRHSGDHIPRPIGAR